MGVTVTTRPAASFQGMPNLGVPFVNENGTVALAWYRLLVSLYNVTLAGLPVLPTGVSPSNPQSLSLANVHSAVTDQGTNFAASQDQQNATFNAQQAAQNVSISTLLDDVITLQRQITALQVQLDALSVGTVAAGAPAPPNTVGFLNVTISGTGYRIALY